MPRIIEIDQMVQTFRLSGDYPSLVIEECEYYLGRECSIQINAPVLREYRGEERVVIPFTEKLPKGAITLYLLFEELSSSNQNVIRQLFPECILLSWPTVQ